MRILLRSHARPVLAFAHEAFGACSAPPLILTQAARRPYPIPSPSQSQDLAQRLTAAAMAAAAAAAQAGQGAAGDWVSEGEERGRHVQIARRQADLSDDDDEGEEEEGADGETALSARPRWSQPPRGAARLPRRLSRCLLFVPFSARDVPKMHCRLCANPKADSALSHPLYDLYRAACCAL